jgi:hypothetical protein
MDEGLVALNVLLLLVNLMVALANIRPKGEGWTASFGDQ